MVVLDEVDRNILSILLENGDTPYAEIGQKVHVSTGTVHVRIKKMKQLGVITGMRVQVDTSKLGYDITAFLGIYLDKSSLYDEVTEQLKNIPEIIGANYTTGNYSIFARIICRDTDHLRQVLHDKIQRINGIQRTETFISLEESILRTVQLDSNT